MTVAVRPAVPRIGRRSLLATTASGVVGIVAGCLTAPAFPDADVIAGPDGRLVFEPEELTVPVGGSVTWGFASSGHNVCGRPDDSDVVELPEAAEPFASYGADASPFGANVPQGETYEHTFEVAGEYVYACVPHVNQGMIGTIRVTDTG